MYVHVLSIITYNIRMYVFVYVRKQNVEFHRHTSICIVRLGFLSLFFWGGGGGGGGDFLGNTHSIFKISKM